LRVIDERNLQRVVAFTPVFQEICSFSSIENHDS